MTLQPLSQLASRSPNVALAADTYSAGMKLAALPLLQTLLGDKGGGTVLEMAAGFPYGIAVQHGDVEIGQFALEMHFVTGASGIKIIPKDLQSPLTGLNLHDLAVRNVLNGSLYQLNGTRKLTLTNVSGSGVSRTPTANPDEYHGIYLNDCRDAQITNPNFSGAFCGSGIKAGASSIAIHGGAIACDPATWQDDDLGYGVYGYPKGRLGVGKVTVIANGVTFTGWKHAAFAMREWCTYKITNCIFEDMDFALYRLHTYDPATSSLNDDFLDSNTFTNCKPLGGKAA